MEIPYDALRQALYHPEAGAPLAMTPDWPQDAIAAEFSRLAYRRFESDPQAKQEIERAIGAIGYGRCGWFGSTGADASHFDAQAFAAVDAQSQAIVAFRGTQADAFLDLVNDASFLLENWDLPGHVHSGFWQSLKTILDPVEAWLAAAAPARVIATGHSLGAALATLLAARRTDAELITFGSPRVGDAAFAAAMSGRTVRRYVDCTDAVTEVPPPPFYRHLSGLHYIDHKGALHDGDDPQISLMADHAAAQIAFLPLMWRAENVHLRALADHAPINYVSAVLGVRAAP